MAKGVGPICADPRGADNGTAGYRAAWSLFFGAKSSDPALVKRINAGRMRDDPLFFQRFLEVFPEIRDHTPVPDAFARFVFASLRGIALLKIFDMDDSRAYEELAALARAIVHAGLGAAQADAHGDPVGFPARTDVLRQCSCRCSA